MTPSSLGSAGAHMDTALRRAQQRTLETRSEPGAFSAKWVDVVVERTPLWSRDRRETDQGDRCRANGAFVRFSTAESAECREGCTRPQAPSAPAPTPAATGEETIRSLEMVASSLPTAASAEGGAPSPCERCRRAKSSREGPGFINDRRSPHLRFPHLLHRVLLAEGVYECTLRHH